MSRLYEMYVEISGHDQKKDPAIRNAANEEWKLDDWYDDTRRSTGIRVMSATGQSSLCGGESEEEFSERFTLAVWKANGKPCKVYIVATCLEDLPHETYEFDEHSDLAKGFKPEPAETEE